MMWRDARKLFEAHQKVVPIPTNCTLMVNPEVEAEQAVTKTRDEEIGYRTKQRSGERSCAREMSWKENVRRGEFANPEPKVAAPSEVRTDATTRAREAVVGSPQKTWKHWEGSSSSAEKCRYANDKRWAATVTWCAD